MLPVVPVCQIVSGCWRCAKQHTTPNHTNKMQKNNVRTKQMKLAPKTFFFFTDSFSMAAMLCVCVCVVCSTFLQLSNVLKFCSLLKSLFIADDAIYIHTIIIYELAAMNVRFLFSNFQSAKCEGKNVLDKDEFSVDFDGYTDFICSTK